MPKELRPWPAIKRLSPRSASHATNGVPTATAGGKLRASWGQFLPHEISFPHTFTFSLCDLSTRPKCLTTKKSDFGLVVPTAHAKEGAVVFFLRIQEGANTKIAPPPQFIYSHVFRIPPQVKRERNEAPTVGFVPYREDHDFTPCSRKEFSLKCYFQAGR